MCPKPISQVEYYSSIGSPFLSTGNDQARRWRIHFWLRRGSATCACQAARGRAGNLRGSRELIRASVRHALRVARHDKLPAVRTVAQAFVLHRLRQRTSFGFV
jgi:hypothetical protein